MRISKRADVPLALSWRFMQGVTSSGREPTGASVTAACTAGPTGAQLRDARDASDIDRALGSLPREHQELLRDAMTPRNDATSEERGHGAAANAIHVRAAQNGGRSTLAERKRIESDVASALAAMWAAWCADEGRRRDEARAIAARKAASRGHMLATLRALAAPATAEVRRVAGAVRALLAPILGKREGCRDDADE